MRRTSWCLEYLTLGRKGWAGLLEEAGEDSYGFVHDVIREVVEGDLGLARRRLLRRQVALALEGQGGSGLPNHAPSPTCLPAATA